MTEPNFAARNQTEVLLRQRRDILTIPWLCATVLIGGYAVVLAVYGRTVAEPLPPGLGPALMGAGVVLALLSVLLPLRQLGDKRLEARLRVPIEAYFWARSMRLRGVHAETFKALPPEEQRMLGLTILYQKPYAIGLALANAVATIGVVYGFLSKALVEAAPFLLVALALNCWHYPRLAPLIDRGRKLDRVEEEQEALELLEKLEPAEAQRKSAQRAQPRLRRPSRAQRPTNS